MELTKIRKRDGRMVEFHVDKIADAINKAFQATYKPGQEETARRLAGEVLTILETDDGKSFEEKRKKLINFSAQK